MLTGDGAAQRRTFQEEEARGLLRVAFHGLTDLSVRNPRSGLAIPQKFQPTIPVRPHLLSPKSRYHLMAHDYSTPPHTDGYIFIHPETHNAFDRASPPFLLQLSYLQEGRKKLAAATKLCSCIINICDRNNPNAAAQGLPRGYIDISSRSNEPTANCTQASYVDRNAENLWERVRTGPCFTFRRYAGEGSVQERVRGAIPLCLV
jgi:hypothetical protein